MLEYNSIDISEGTDFKKSNDSKKYKICHYWYFKDICFKYEPYLFIDCHSLMQKAISFNDVAIDCNGTGTHNHLVRKRRLNHLAKLTK